MPHSTPSQTDEYYDSQDEWALWSQYIDGMDALHATWVRDGRHPKSGYVYLAELYIPGEAGQSPTYVKIGISRTPKQRVEQWSKSVVKMPYRVNHFHTFWAEDARATEKMLHQMFRRHRTDGEWFQLSHDITSVLRDIWYASPYHTLDMIEFRSIVGQWDFPMPFILRELRELKEQQQRHAARRSCGGNVT